MNRFIKTFLLLSTLALPLQGKLPNIVFILADDMGVGDVSALNPDAKVNTPHLDKLAAGGTVFTDAHSDASVCTPTRYTLMTGRYCWRTHLKERVLNSYSPCLIPKDRDTVASLLKRNGYNTAMIGKWHLGLNWTPKAGKMEIKEESDVDFSKSITHGPLQLGFDYWYGFGASWDMAPYAIIENNRLLNPQLETVGGEQYPLPKEAEGLRADERKKVMAKYPKATWRPGMGTPGMKAEHALPLLAERAASFINEYKSNKPLFLYVPLTSPHTPVTPSERFRGSSECGTYGDFVHETDWVVGEIIAALKAKKMLDNTLVIFTADNGASIKAIPVVQQEEFDHSPSHIYSGYKGRIEEGGHRVPFIAHWPMQVKAGAMSDYLLTLGDLYATCADLLNSEIAPDTAEDSFSFLHALRGSEAPQTTRDFLVHHTFGGDFGFRHNGWKINLGNPNSTKLYHLEEDIREQNIVSKDHPEQIERLKAKLTKIIQNGSSRPGANSLNDGPKHWKQLNWITPESAN